MTGEGMGQSLTIRRPQKIRASPYSPCTVQLLRGELWRGRATGKRQTKSRPVKCATGCQGWLRYGTQKRVVGSNGSTTVTTRREMGNVTCHPLSPHLLVSCPVSAGKLRASTVQRVQELPSKSMRQPAQSTAWTPWSSKAAPERGRLTYWMVSPGIALLP